MKPGGPPGAGSVPPRPFAFEPRRMVSWFHPLQIIPTAIRAVFSELITSYIDSRLVQAGLHKIRLSPEVGRSVKPMELGDGFATDLCFAPSGTPLGPNGRRGTWIDYVADTGDGFDATYAVASLIGRENIKIRGLEKPLPRAQLLVMGGDQVYPAPSRAEYRNRLEGPYDAALSQVKGEPANQPPTLLAIPGNHDWYDGLTSFSRLFCQGSRIGAWQTRQSRSYFAVQLPGNWALWGVDIQLDNRIDLPQLEFFARAARELDATKSHPRIILCTARPGWLDLPDFKTCRKNFWFLVDRTTRNGCAPTVALSGDLHHYSRYSDSSGRQLITAGGGGSYLRGTHDLPDTVEVPAETEEYVTGDGVWSDREPDEGTYRDSGFTYPSRNDSRRLAMRALGFPFYGANWMCCLLLGAAYLWFVWTLRWGTDPGATLDQLISLLKKLGGLPIGMEGAQDAFRFLWGTVPRWPSTWLPPAAFVVSLASFCWLSNPVSKRWPKWLWGTIHAFGHVISAFAVAWLLARVIETTIPAWLPVVRVATWLGGIVVSGGLVGGFLMGAYLVLSDQVFAWHLNEAFVAQSIPDFRCFLRMCVEDDGTLTIYPIGLRRVPRRWRRTPGHNPWEARFEPREGQLEAELIEGPITIPPAT